MKEYWSLIIWTAVIGLAFAYLWWKGHLKRLASFIIATREELKKCTWPTMNELKGSTAVIIVSIALLGGFIVVVDFIASTIVRFII
ncbi:MAG: preprotein translocase subunit SecE [Verrucomicrobia bacterium]|nr:preprotein translocase subunit SecE [Verrucomicrobiota bacterium]